MNYIRDKKIRDKNLKKKSGYISFNTISAIEREETHILILKAIERLPPKCKDVFIRSRYEGKKYAEIALEMNISVKTVEAQMGKALKVLRNQLSDLNKL